MHAGISMSVVSCLALLAFEASAQAPPPAQSKPGRQCLSELRAFNGTLKNEGYWLHDSGFGYGYPIYGYGTAMVPIIDMPSEGRYVNARPGYEVRTLIASANILAKRGQQAACESVLKAAKGLYASYSADMRDGKFPRTGRESRLAEIASAQPVIDDLGVYRSDQLVGTALVNPQGDNLGSVDDIVMSPQTGKITYLVIGRGGVLGIDEDFVPIPWSDFKATSGSSLLVVNATKADMEAAPQVKKDAFSSNGKFIAGKVDDYWRAHLTR